MTLINRKHLISCSVKILGTMLVFCVVAVLVTKLSLGVANSLAITDDGYVDKEMVLAFVVNRHGERTPAEEEAALSKDLDKIKHLIQIEGYEGLTNDGKRRAYQIGKYLRHRYGSNQGCRLLSEVYLKDDITVRSTFKDRTQMTAQIAMSALYPPPPVQQWDNNLGRIWQPVPYTSIPLSEDYLRYYSNCNYFKMLMKQAKDDSINNEFAPYNDLIPLLKEKTGANFTEDPLLFETLYDLFHSQVGLGLDIPAWAKPLLPRLTAAAKLAYRLYFRTDEMKRIGGGVMLNDFIKAAEEVASGKATHNRFRLFSSHDFNIGSFMDVSKVENSHEILPEYGAVFSLELYRSKVNEEYYVLPVYLSQAGDSLPKQLKFKMCEDNFCDFEIFRNMTAEYLLPEAEFYKLCDIRTEL